MSGSRSRDSSAIAQEWLNRALDDLRVARHTLTLKPDCPYAIVCFHAQQAVEKSLKAILTRLGRQFPKTHDLTELVPMLPDSLREQLTEIEFDRLNPYAVEARYPGDLEPVTRQEALAALRTADQTCTVVTAWLDADANSGPGHHHPEPTPADSPE